MLCNFCLKNIDNKIQIEVIEDVYFTLSYKYIICNHCNKKVIL
jgi:hypothetical protein